MGLGKKPTTSPFLKLQDDVIRDLAKIEPQFSGLGPEEIQSLVRYLSPIYHEYRSLDNEEKILKSLTAKSGHVDSAYLDQLKNQIDIVLETNYLETIKVMVSANLGWSILPQSMTDASLTSHPLSELDVERPLGLVTRRNRTLGLSSQAMIEMLRETREQQHRNAATAI